MTGMAKAITQTERESELSWKGMTIGIDLSDKFTSLCFIDERVRSSKKEKCAQPRLG